MSLSDHILDENRAYNWKRARSIIAAAEGRLSLEDVQPLDDLEMCVFNLVKWEFEGRNKNHKTHPMNDQKMANH